MKGVRVIVIILLAAAVVGCSRYIESRNPVRSLPDAGRVPINLAARLDNGSVTISWEVADSTDIARFRVYVADSTGLDYTPWDSTTGFSITPEGLKINQRYFFKVAAVANSGLESELSEAVSARIMHLSIMIQNDREYTNSRDVLIQVSSPPKETSHLMLSENPTLTDAVFVWFDSTGTSFQLSEGDGVKTVYARLQFFDGTRSGELLSDDIILDTRARIDSVFFTPSGKTFSSGDTITFGLGAGETGGEASVAFTSAAGVMPLYDNGSNGDSNARDGIYSGSWVVPDDFTFLYNGDVIGSFTDAVGNQAVQIGAQQLLNINNPPEPVKLYAFLQHDTIVNFIWTICSDEDFASYRLYRKDSADVDESDIMIAIVTVQDSLTYHYKLPNTDTTYYFRIFVFDQHGLSAGSNVDSVLSAQ